MVAKLGHVVGVLAACLAHFQPCRGEEIAVLEIIPRQEYLGKKHTKFKSSLVDEHIPQRSIVLEGVTASIDSKIFLQERFARVKLSAMDVYPELLCDMLAVRSQDSSPAIFLPPCDSRTELKTRIEFNYSYETLFLDSSSPMKYGECTVDTWLPVTTTELVFRVRTSAVDKVNNPSKRLVVNADWSMNSDHKFPSLLINSDADLVPLHFLHWTCPRYGNRGRIIECRCKRNNISIGEFTTPEFVPVSHDERVARCEYRTWQNHSLREAVLWLTVETGRVCQFLCQVNVTYGLPPVIMTPSIVYNITGYRSHAEVLAHIYNKLVYISLFVVLSGIMVFALTLLTCRCHINQRAHLHREDITHLMEARLRRHTIEVVNSGKPDHKTEPQVDLEHPQPQTEENNKKVDNLIVRPVSAISGTSGIRDRVKKQIRWATERGSEVDWKDSAERGSASSNDINSSVTQPEVDLDTNAHTSDSDSSSTPQIVGTEIYIVFR